MKASFAEFIKSILDIGETIIWRSYPDLEAMKTHVLLEAKGKLLPWFFVTALMVIGLILEFKFNIIMGVDKTTVFTIIAKLIFAMVIIIPSAMQLIKNLRHVDSAEYIAKNTAYVVTDKNLFIVSPDMLWGGWKYQKVNLWSLQGLVTKEFTDMKSFGNIYFVHNDHENAEKLAETNYYSQNGFMFVKDLENIAGLIEKVKGRHFHSRAASIEKNKS